MKRASIYLTLAFTVTFALASCSKSNDVAHNVAPEFEEYIQKFFSDAERYGVEIADKGIVMKFATLTDGKAGVTYMNRKPVYIEIDTEAWNDMTGPNEKNEKEDLIFHEMGHGFLRRYHLNDTLKNGDWKTMMCGDELPHGRGSNINYRGMRKEYYIKELFTQTTEVPSWSTYIPDFSSLKETALLDETPSDASPHWYKCDTESAKARIEGGCYVWTSLIDGTTYIPILNNQKRTDILDVTKDFYFEAKVKAVTEKQDVPMIGIGFADYNTETKVINPLHYMLFTTTKFINIGENSCKAPFIQLYNTNINASDFNTLGIRKSNDTLYYYLNDNFIYHNDLTDIPVSGKTLGLLVSGGASIYVSHAKIATTSGVKNATDYDGGISNEPAAIDLGIMFSKKKKY